MRKDAAKCELRGIFVGAKVVRGFNWEWGNQDGGDGKFLGIPVLLYFPYYLSFQEKLVGLLT